MHKPDLYSSEYVNLYGNHIHHTAIIGENVEMGKGNVIGPYTQIGEIGFIRQAKEKEGKVVIGDKNRIGSMVTIMAGTEGVTSIGNNNLIMNKASIGHNAVIGNECEIGAHSVVLGHAKIRDQVNIKANATIRNRKKIGTNATIGMGSVVVADVPENCTVCGNPAKRFIK